MEISTIKSNVNELSRIYIYIYILYWCGSVVLDKKTITIKHLCIV